MGVTLHYLEDGEPARETGIHAVRTRLKDLSGPYWLSLKSPGEGDLAWLGETWRFHPLTLDDCRVFNPRPKLEEYSGYLFLVLHEIDLRRERAEANDLQVYFSTDYLITVQKGGSVVLDRISDRGADLSRGVDFLLYRVMSELVEDYFDIIDGLDDHIETVESQVVGRPGRPVLERVFFLRKNLVTLLRAAAPFREMLHMVESHDYPFVRPEHQLYFRDVHNSLVYVHEMIETQRDLTGGALEVYMSSVSNSLNEVLKRLTLIATIFMPVSFIAAFWGMNFQHLPFAEPLAMWLTIAAAIVLPLGMLAWFRAKGWA